MSKVSKITIFHLLLLTFFCITINSNAQSGKVKSGPWAGNVESRNATIWVEVTASVKSVEIKYNAVSAPAQLKSVKYSGALGGEFNPIKIELNGLKVNTRYKYTVLIDNKPFNTEYPTEFTTKDLWQWRKPAPDFTFLTGSCAYFNEPEFDRPGRAYGSDSSIFETMAKQKAAFNLWLGDNWYYREVDYYTIWGLKYRPSRDRSLPILQKFFGSTSHYAIWDDHDYGPNDQGKSFILKDSARKIFMSYWCNPSYGEDGKGIYTKFSYSDVDYFLTDDRYFRSEDKISDTINGSVNKLKTFLGPQQMEWLKNSLVYSNATFKIVAVGSQVLNPLWGEESFKNYSAEYNELLDFIALQNIKGVLFFTGDIHHSEIMKKERPGKYPLYDITASSFTAGIKKAEGDEITNPSRVPGTLVQVHNFAKVTVTGAKNNRKLSVEFIDKEGNKQAEWTVNENELK
ncbi:alkaline phosphatase D family protein [soil metagenome]